jgi:hypothetical protein
MMTTYVIDQNMMQSPDLVALIQREPDAFFVLPDVAFVEMSKHPNWELTMSLALAPLATVAPNVQMSLSISEPMRAELANRRASNSGDLLSPEHSDFARDVILEFAEARDGARRKEIQERFDLLRRDLLAAELDSNSAKERTKRFVDPLLRGLRPKVLAALRKPGADPHFVLCFIQAYANILFEESLVKEHGFNELAAVHFRDAKPLTLRYFYLTVRHAVKTALKGTGWEAIRADRELNNHLDQHYALLASYFDGLLSNDGGAQSAYADLLAMLSTQSLEAAQVAVDALAAINDASDMSA